MADNYLEKQYERMQSGSTVYRKDNPSLETLLHRLDRSEQLDPTYYIVKQAQLDAIVRAGRLVEGSERVTFGTSEQESTVTICCDEQGLLLGAITIVCRLKAAEMSLSTSATRITRGVSLKIYR